MDSTRRSYGRRSCRRRSCNFVVHALAVACALAFAHASPVGFVELIAQAVSSAPASGPPASFTDYVVGPQDVLTITSYDQADLSGKFAVEADGTFTYPLIGRVKAGGLTLRALEGAMKKRLKDEGFFKNPQITVAVETYKSQRVFIVGEVRTPGTYPLSGNTNLVEALARAGSTLPTASGEAVIVHAGRERGRADAADADRRQATSCAWICASWRTASSRRTRGCATATRSSCRARRASTCSAR